MQKFLFIKFTIILSLYYASYAIIIGYAALFMQHKGFNNMEVGVFFACSAVSCIVMQFVSGSLLDQFLQFSSKILIQVASIIVLIFGLILFLSENRFTIFLCYIVIGSFMLVNSSLFNSLGMEYINADIHLNYSLARGFGSLSYALTSLAIGIIIKRYSVMSIFPAFFLAQGLMFLGLFILIPAKRNLLFQKSRDTDGSSCGFVHLFTKRPCFLFLLVSILLVYISYTAINHFHINIIQSVGGVSPELGVSTSLAAMLELPAMALFVPVSKKVSYRHLLSISCVFFFLKAFLMLFSKNISGIYLSQCLQFFSYGLFVPASAYFINSVLPIQDKTKGQAALGIFTFGLSGLVSSVLSGVLLDHFTVRTMLALESGLAFIGMFGVIVACHLLASGKDI